MRSFNDGNTPISSGFSKRIAALTIGIVSLLVVLVLSFSLFEQQDADTVMVIQSPFSGSLTWYTDAGVKWQGFGKVTKYQKRSQYWFSAKTDQGEDVNQAIKVRFNDGGHGNISGSLAWEMPQASDSMLTALHTKYGSQHAIEQQLVRTVTEKAVYMTGPVMSSKESYAERRNDLIRFIDDQIINGVYKTTTKEVKDKDPLSGQERTNKVVDLVLNSNGTPQRQDESPLTTFGIRVFNLSINSVDYDSDVESQIQTQQKATMQVQTARANAQAAEQDAITVAKRGEANAAEAKWKQEVIKAQLVTEAQQKLEVAKLEAATAEQYKKKKILEAEGDAEYKRKIIVADGALTQKLAAIVEMNRDAWTAIGNYKGNWQPQVVMGGVGNGGKDGTNVSGVQQMLGLITTKFAHDLALDFSVKGKTAAVEDK